MSTWRSWAEDFWDLVARDLFFSLGPTEAEVEALNVTLQEAGAPRPGQE